MLTLPINRNWFELIQQGTKLEEYRAINAYYDARFLRYEGQLLQLCLRNGYRADSPSLFCTVIPRRGLLGRPEWGAIAGERYWVLDILSIDPAA